MEVLEASVDETRRRGRIREAHAKFLGDWLATRKVQTGRKTWNPPAKHGGTHGVRSGFAMVFVNQ